MLAHIISVYLCRENAQTSGDVLGDLHSTKAKGHAFVTCPQLLTPTTSGLLATFYDKNSLEFFK